MAGFLDDLIQDEKADAQAPQVEVRVPDDDGEPKGPTGKGGDARTSLYGDEFMKRYGNRSH